MENLAEELYEYSLKDEMIIQRKCIVIKSTDDGKGFWFTREKMSGHMFVDKSNLGALKNNHIYAFEDNLPKYRKIFIEHIESNIEKLQEQLKQKKRILKKLKR